VKSAIGKWPNRNRLKNSAGNALLALATVMLLSGCDSWNLKRLEIKCANAGPYNIQDQKLWDNYIKLHEEHYMKVINYYIRYRDKQISLFTSLKSVDDEGGYYYIENKPSKHYKNEIHRFDFVLNYKNPKKLIFRRVADLENYSYSYPSIGWGMGEPITKNCVRDYPSGYLGEIEEKINERR